MGMKGRILAILQAILTAVTVLTGAIAVPVLFRPFFYWHIGPMNLTQAVGLEREQVKRAYREMMDYCIGRTEAFSAGMLRFSEEGAAHFADVRKLFVLDLRVLAVAAVLLIVVQLLRKKEEILLKGHTPGFWGAVGLGGVFVAVGALAALDFQRAFVIFHQLFFPGKSNWIFDGRTDPIIYMLPEAFFRNCAILILAGILVGCGGLLLRDRIVRKGT